jgi:cytochrome P450
MIFGPISDSQFSTATTWALYALTQNPDTQTKLRKELVTVSTDNPTMDELNALPYLDHVVRETMRVHAPVPATMRTAMQDDILPLNNPITDKKGKVHTTIPCVPRLLFSQVLNDYGMGVLITRVHKGQHILIPISGLNSDKSLWGEDTLEFKWVEGTSALAETLFGR